MRTINKQPQQTARERQSLNMLTSSGGDQQQQPITSGSALKAGKEKHARRFGRGQTRGGFKL